MAERRYIRHDDGGEAFGGGVMVGGLGTLLLRQYFHLNFGLEVALPAMIGAGILMDRLLNRQYIRPSNETQKERQNDE